MKLGLLLAYTVFLTALLLTTDPWGAMGGEWVMETAPDPSERWESVSLHLLCYLILGGLIWWNDFPPKLTHWALTLGVAHGLGTELLQGFVPKRFTNLDDIAANTLGVILGFFGLRWGMQRYGKYASTKMAVPTRSDLTSRGGEVD